MKRIGEKLHSTSGASIIFALLVFMVCAFGGAAALTAAASNAGRFSHAASDQQQYLSVASAVDMFRETLGSAKLEYTWKLTETKEWNKDSSGGTVYQDPKYTASGEYSWSGDDSGVLQALMGKYSDAFEAALVPSDLYEKVHPGARPGQIGPMALTITGKNDLEKKLDPVRVKLSMDPATYGLTLALGAGEDPDELVYGTTMRLSAVPDRKTESQVNESGSGNTGWTVTTTTMTLTLTWSGDGTVIVRS